MTQSRTAAFIAQADASDNSPVLLVRADLAGGMRYWTSRAGTYGGQAYTEVLKDGLDITLGMDALGRTMRGAGHLLLANEDDGTGSRLSDLFATEIVSNAAIEVDYLFAGLTHPTDSLRVFTGCLDVPEEDCFDDQTVRLGMMDDGNPQWAGIQNLAAARIHQVLGTRITTTAWPNADPDVIGLVEPEIYGALRDAPAYAVDAGALDVLADDVTAAAATIPLSDADLFALFPASGSVQIEDEQIAYAAKAVTSGSAITTSSAGTTYTATSVTDASAWDLSDAEVGQTVKTASGKYGTITFVDDANDTLEVFAWVGGTPSATDVAAVYASGLLLTGCTRGDNGTAAAAHAAGKSCWLLQAEYKYEVAHGAVKSITNVRVDGLLIPPANYTPDLSGPSLIKFTVKPGRTLAVTVATQPAFSATTVSEQSPGSITTTSEQTPGSVTVSAEHAHTTAEGSHGHATDVKVHESVSTPAMAATITAASTSLTFPTTPKTGTAVSFHLRVTQISTSGSGDQTVKIKRDSTVICSIDPTVLGGGVEDVYGGEASVGTGYTLNLGAQVTAAVVVAIDWDITATVSSSSDAASGVSASRSGSTAASMASLSGATASNMATLSGSTAVSLAQTQNVVVSAADHVIGTQVLCDVEGYQDDASGTYTGVPYALITNPADQIQHILAVQLGLTLADWADSTTFAAARAAFAAAGIRCDWGLYDQIDSAELLERLRWSVAARLFQAADGKFKLHALPLAGSSAKTLTEADNVLSVEAGGGPIRVGRTSLADLYNQVYVLHTKRLSGAGYGGYIAVEDATSQASYRMKRALILENDFVRDAVAADAIADALLAWHKDQKWRTTLTIYAPPALHLEPCDKVSITASRLPGGWTAKAHWIESTAKQLGRPGQLDSITLTLREA